MLIAAPMGFGLMALGEPVLHFLYAKNPAMVAIGGEMLSVLGLAAIFVAMTGPVNAILQGIGRLDLPVVLVVVGGGISLLFNYVFVGVPSINIKAAPYGNLLSYLVVALLSLLFLYRNTKIKIDYMTALIKPLASGAACGVAAYLLYFLQMRFLSAYIRPKLATIIAIAFAIIVYVICIAISRVITKEEVNSLPGGKKIANLLEKLGIVR
jgi:stage V sporulation protein B